jgi:hypothetical protein
MTKARYQITLESSLSALAGDWRRPENPLRKTDAHERTLP